MKSLLEPKIGINVEEKLKQERIDKTRKEKEIMEGSRAYTNYFQS